MKRTALMIGFASLALPATVLADEAILIGGGYELQGSQGQIELNVGWVSDILGNNGIAPTTFFTDGDREGPDVHYVLPVSEISRTFEPLARVFGHPLLEQRRYREHELPDVVGGTQRELLEPALADLLSETADEPLLLVYNGHGSQSPSSPAGVTLNLWNNTTMTAGELHGLLDTHRGESSQPLRYVFTQCYSGGFHRLAYADPESGLALSDTPRCGFTAESAYRLAEGCSAGIDIGDYRDYTTYFFAALADSERDGSVLDRIPDVNDDGSVTLREAHLHALEKAWSTDLSRSSSENWLESWQPWHLRWLPTPNTPPNNEYAELFRRMATEADISLGTRIGKTLRTRLDEDEASLALLRDERRQLLDAIDESRQALQQRAGARWPALLGPYTGAFAALSAEGGLEEAAAWLSEEPEYAELREQQTRESELERSMLDVERNATQNLKLLRLRQLAHLKQQLSAYGSDEDQASYAALLACEETPLNITGNRTDTTVDTTAEVIR